MVGAGGRRVSWFDRKRAERAQSHGPGSPLDPGRTWLLSVDGDGTADSAALWRLESGVPEGVDQVGFHGRARRSLDVESALARLEVPLLVDARSLQEVGWRAVSVLKPGGGPVHRLDGASFGLAMVLAASSRLIGLPLPTTLVATAAVSESGRIEEVDGLAAKLALLGHEALVGPIQCLVAASQVERAQELAPDGVEVVGIARLDEAIELAFTTDLEAHLRQRWAPEGSRGAAATTFFRLAVDGSNRLLGWRSLARAAELLAELGEDDPWAWKVDVAARIARRHANEAQPIALDAEWLATLPRPRRIQLIAHQVQAAADATSPDWEEQLAGAWAALPEEGDEHAEELQLLGAIGRAEAAWGRYPTAESALRRAVRGWMALDAEPQASYALCELLRVVGITGQGIDPELQAAIARFRRDPRPDPMSRAFVTMALGRAHAQLGAHDAAVAELTGDTRWDHSPAHVQATRHRWLAQAVHATDPGRAQQEWDALDRLVARVPHVTRFASALATLDRAALHGAEAEEGVEAMLAAPDLGRDARRILEFTGAKGANAQAAALRAHWRY